MELPKRHREDALWGCFVGNKMAYSSARAEMCHAVGPLQLVIPPYWRANCALEHLKQSNQIKKFVLYGLVRNFLSSVAIFVPCDRQVQRAHFNNISVRSTRLLPFASVEICARIR